jgi:hypothetical protein
MPTLLYSIFPPACGLKFPLVDDNDTAILLYDNGQLFFTHWPSSEKKIREEEQRAGPRRVSAKTFAFKS